MNDHQNVPPPQPSFHPANQQGFALVAAISVLALLLVLGAGAMVMSQLGYFGAGAERRYQLANWAAEYAIYAGVSRAYPEEASGGGTITDTGAEYAYLTIPEPNVATPSSDYRMIHGTGTYGNARVVKIAVVPVPGGIWGGMNTIGGNLSLEGNSAIAGCDTDVSEENLCINTGINSFGPLEISAQQGESTLVECPGSPGQFQGIMGDPPTQNRAPRDDLANLYFDVDDNAGVVAAVWAEHGIELSIDGKMQFVDPPPEDCRYDGSEDCRTDAENQIICGDYEPPEEINTAQCGKIYLGNELTTLNISHDITAGTLDDINLVATGTVAASAAAGHSDGHSLNIFADNIDINQESNTTVHGGVYYSHTRADIDVGSNTNFGTVANPVLFVAQGEHLSFGRDGGGKFHGMIYADADNVELVGTGNWSLHGSIVSNGPITGSPSGDWSVRLNMDVLQALAGDGGSAAGLLKPPICGVPNNSFLSFTKSTLY